MKCHVILHVFPHMISIASQTTLDIQTIIGIYVLQIRMSGLREVIDQIHASNNF